MDISAVVAVLGACIAAISAYMATQSSRTARRAFGAKLTDRLYELDKLIMTYPREYALYARLSARATADYFATTLPRLQPEPAGAAVGRVNQAAQEMGVPESTEGKPSIEQFYRLKAFAYFYLNLFDEIHWAYGDGEDTAWPAWREYMFARIAHPLVKEVLSDECGRGVDGKLKVGAPSAFRADFVDFLNQHIAEWKDRSPPLGSF